MSELDDGMGCAHGVASCDPCLEAHSAQVRALERQLAEARARARGVVLCENPDCKQREIRVDDPCPTCAVCVEAQEAEAQAQIGAMREALEELADDMVTADHHRDDCPDEGGCHECRQADRVKAALDPEAGKEFLARLLVAEARADKQPMDLDQTDKRHYRERAEKAEKERDAMRATTAAARCEALEEAARLAELHGNAFAGFYGQAQLVKRTADAIASSIRALKK